MRLPTHATDASPCLPQAIHPALVDSVRDLECFKHEVHILARCCHPNIVKLLGACLVPPQPFLVEELMACSLKDAIYDAQQPLDLMQVKAGRAMKQRERSCHKAGGGGGA